MNHRHNSNDDKKAKAKKNGDPESHVTVIITSAKKAAGDARNVRVDTARGSDNDQQNLSN